MPAAFLLLLALLNPQQETRAEGCRLSGVAVSSVTGEALNKVEVQAEPIGPGQRLAASTTTDAKGTFTLVDLSPGQYRLKVLRNGYLESYYGARRAGGFGTTLALEPGQEIKDLQIKLTPCGSISGTVLDTDGEPMSNASITLLRQYFRRIGYRTASEVENGRTDGLGQYHIGGLEPGRYFVRAERQARNAFGFRTPVDHSLKSEAPPPVLLPTLYPGVIDPAAARAVEVGPGARVAGVDIMLVRSSVFTVSARASAAAGLAITGVWLMPAGEADMGVGRFNSPEKSREGDYVFYGVPRGSYVLVARAETTGPGPRRGSLARLPVLVDGEVKPVPIVVSGETEVTGRVTVDGGALKLPPGLSITFASEDGESEETRVGDYGRFAVRLQPGARYHVFIDRDAANLFVRSVRSEGIDAYKEVLTVAEGARPVVDVVLAADAGKLDGVVLDKEEKPAAGATVVLVAEPGLRARFDSFHVCAADQYGRYQFENIRPGAYRLFAWEDIEPNAWFDPELLKSVEEKAEEVTIRPGGRETSKPHLIAAEAR